MKRLSVFASLMVAVFFARATCSQETGWINVVQVGGQGANLFVVLSQSIVNPGCSGSWIIVPSGALDADSQKRFYAALLTAMATGKQIRLAVSGCNDVNHPAMISTDYWFIQS